MKFVMVGVVGDGEELQTTILLSMALFNRWSCYTGGLTVQVVLLHRRQLSGFNYNIDTLYYKIINHYL